MKNREIDEIEEQIRKVRRDFYIGVTFSVMNVIALIIVLTKFCN